MSISIKISEDNYKWLSSLSGELRKELHKPVSINDAISHLNVRGKISELAGSWAMTDEEANIIMKDLKKGWKNWGKKSA